MEFIYGIILGILICLGIQWGIKRLFGGDSDRSGVDNAIDREGELQDSLDDTRNELSGDIESARDRSSERFDEAGEQIRSENSITDNSIRSTDSIIDKIKKRNSP